MSVGSNDLEAFYQFMTENYSFLSNRTHGEPLTPEQCLEMWRTQYATGKDFEQSAAAVQHSIQEMEAGDVGKPARSLIEDAYVKHGLARDA